MVAQGASLRAMAGALAAAGTRTASGQPFSPTQVRRHLERLGLVALVVDVLQACRPVDFAVVNV
jgi:hypothetical protein